MSKGLLLMLMRWGGCGGAGGCCGRAGGGLLVSREYLRRSRGSPEEPGVASGTGTKDHKCAGFVAEEPGVTNELEGVVIHKANYATNALSHNLLGEM